MKTGARVSDLMASSYDFIILLNSSVDSGKNEVLFVKVGARVLDLWLAIFSGLKWRKCSL